MSKMSDTNTLCICAFEHHQNKLWYQDEHSDEVLLIVVQARSQHTTFIDSSTPKICIPKLHTIF
jgi:hypothetical protein